MKVVVLDGFLAGYGLNGLPLPDTFKIEWYDNTPPEQTIERIGTAEAVFVNRLRLDARVFEACPSLRFAGTFGTGYNMIDLDAARRAGVTVCNVPAYSTAAVAQNTISLLLNIATMTHIHSRYVSTGHWTDPTDHALVSVPMFELAGKTIGLIGCGDIGAAVGRIAAAFGMRVLACRRHPNSFAGTHIRFVDLDTLYGQSDIVSLHCPLTPQTRGMIDRAAIGRMKDGAVLLNTARGGLLCERDVADALDCGKLYMAGLDVLCDEPPAPDSPLARHPRVICTPHISWMPRETRARLLRAAADNLLCFLEGNPQNVIV